MSKQLSANISRTFQTKLILPQDTNHLGTVFGGTILAYIDEIAAIAAMKHCKKTVVTAAIDSVNFLSSAKAGDILTLEAVVISTGKTSLEVYVKVETEQLDTQVKTTTTTSFLTFVAIDEDGKPTAVPEVIPETELEKQLNKNAQARKDRRIQAKNEFN